ncbi:hypothetical protein CGT98_17610 [Vibrio metoecus]|uniref:DUF4435 domain-containing protein n=1 Tax=Vibrio metoecus TaxID=1481663 RepID=UPI000BA950AB|nr:AAA family ATPase [Vibrio metoecus]PAR36164.1 hypothetical protein CGT98_17610 [Vibrio metoecus]
MIENLRLPKSGNSKEVIDLPVKKTVVVTGANGSGKTRLGSWLEFTGSQNEYVRRISAQKSLSMPDSSSTTSMEEAECDLIYGNRNIEYCRNNPVFYKTHDRWNGKISTGMLNDYDKLMVLLFTDMFQKTIDHSEGKTVKNESLIYKIKNIWEQVLPHRELVIEAGKVKTKIKGDDASIYNASDMSDGERVVFYLIGQCLTLKKEKILVIDEPELHLHKSIHAKLWSLLEAEVSDCVFVYITHDLDFAARKKDADKVWVQSFDGENWIWSILPETEDLPEDLVLEVLGSRQSVVLVEGTNSSFDLQLYSVFYDSSLVLPKGSCANVIQIVKGLNESGIINDKKVFGVIDRDRRSDSEVTNLEKSGIYVLDVAEVENLFILPEIFEIVCNSLAFDFSEKYSMLIERVLSSFESELEMQVSKRVSSEVMHKLRLFNDKSNTRLRILDTYKSVVSGIDIDAVFNHIESEYKTLISEKNYLGVLKYYNRKSLLTLAGDVLGIKKGEYSALVIRLSCGVKKGQIRNALSSYLPPLD